MPRRPPARRFVSFAVLVTLAGCGGSPPPPPPTIVNLTLTTTADVNASSPIALRVYQLASPANFSGAEFFPLYNTDATVLKTDLVRREDFLLGPGQTKAETIKPDPTVKSLGVVAAYRDFQHATWRAVVDVDANKTTAIAVTAGHDGVAVKASPVPQPTP